MTSLIDVIFLLLLFFMLSSTFSKYSKLEISASTNGGGVTTQQKTNLIALDGALIRFNGQATNIDDLYAQFAQSSDDQKTILIITTSPQTSTQQLVDVLSKFSNIDSLNITIAR
ncbi:MAG: biopolymer transporter ExbD [Lentilitoribacter sp.]